MEKLKNLLLVLLPPTLILLVSWALSMNNDFSWNGVLFLLFVIVGMEICLWIKSPQKLINSVLGFMFSGTLYVFMAAEVVHGLYADIFEFLFLTMFAYTVLCICIPNIYNNTKSK